MTRRAASRPRVSGKLMFVSGYVYRILRREARRAGLRWTAILVLKDLDLLGPLSQQALADIEQVKRSTMTVLLRQVEELGWVKRSVHTENRSSKLVHLTATGRRALRAAGRTFVAQILASIEGLAERDIPALDRGLTALAHLWTKEIHARRRAKRSTDR